MSTSSKTFAIDEDLRGYYEETEDAAAEHFTDKQDLIQRTPWWIISIVFHAAFLLMAAMWTISSTKDKEEFSIFEMNVKKFKKPEYDPTLKRDIKRSNKEVKDEVQVENPVITKEDLEIDELETPDNMDREHKAKGRQEAMSTIELGGEGWVGVFGVGGGGSGSYGWRDGGGKRRAIGRFGGGAASESAVLAALRWFKRHQNAEGFWSLYHYFDECKLAPPCDHLGGFGRSDNKHYQQGERNCATGFALLCFLGAGHTHKAGKFRQQVANGLSFLKESQKPDGSFCLIGYQHAVATMAAAEAYGMTKSPELKEMAQKAVDFSLQHQNKDGYLGWDYVGPTTRNDTSVTGWQTMAMKSAKASGLDIGNSFEGIKNLLEKITPELKGGPSEPMLDGDVAYAYNSAKDKASSGNIRLTAIGMLCRVFIGEDTNSEMLRAHANRQLLHLPKPKRMDFYQWYYATLAMFQMGGEYWKQWNESMKTVLLDSQAKGGCADGSWDAASAPHGRSGGRIFTTAIGCLSLEVYYRYLPVAMLKK
ncbi:hypothetical protein ACFL6F_00745 [Planctomycetota bacterium]